MNNNKNIKRWFTVVETVDIETGEVLNRKHINKQEYKLKRKTKTI